MKCHLNTSAGLPKAFHNFVILVFLVGGGYYLWMQHRAHVLHYWPFAFFLLCPLMHLFGGCGYKHSPDDSNENGGHHHA